MDGFVGKLPPEITVVGCWAHLRRKFTDALKSLPPSIQSKSPAGVGLAYCNELFGLEADYSKRELDFENCQYAQNEKSKTFRVSKIFFRPVAAGVCREGLLALGR